MPSRWRTAPPSGNEFVPRSQKAAVGRWGAGGRSEDGSRWRGRYDRTLKRWSEANRWGRGPLEADESTRGEVAERSGADAGRLWSHSAEKDSAGHVRRPRRPSVCGGDEAVGVNELCIGRDGGRFASARNLLYHR